MFGIFSMCFRTRCYNVYSVKQLLNTIFKFKANIFFPASCTEVSTSCISIITQIK